MVMIASLIFVCYFLDFVLAFRLAVSLTEIIRITNTVCIVIIEVIISICVIYVITSCYLIVVARILLIGILIVPLQV